MRFASSQASGLLVAIALLAACEREPDVPRPAQEVAPPAVAQPVAPTAPPRAPDETVVTPVAPRSQPAPDVQLPAEGEVPSASPKRQASTASRAEKKEPVERVEVEAPVLDLSLPEDWAAEIVPEPLDEQTLLPPLFEQTGDDRLGLRGRLIEGRTAEHMPDGAELEFEFRR